MAISHTLDQLQPSVVLTVVNFGDVTTRLQELITAKHTVVAVLSSSDPSKVHIFYSVRAKPTESSYCFNIHDLCKSIRGLQGVENAAYPAGQHTDKLPPGTTKNCERIARALEPLLTAAHVLGARETAAILLRAYDIGRQDAATPERTEDEEDVLAAAAFIAEKKAAREEARRRAYGNE